MGVRFDLVVLAAACAAAAGARAACPPEGFDSVSGFNLTEYIAAPWYIQEQQVNSYQPENSLFCVRAAYLSDGADSGLLRVDNFAREGSVDGPRRGDSAAELRAAVVDEDKGQLKVGPSFLPRALYGPYWVVALGPEARWAVISGGPPTEETPGGCVNPENARGLFGNNEGLWIFHRDEVAPPADVADAKSAAEALGFDLSLLRPVVQEGCTYDEPFAEGGDDTAGGPIASALRMVTA